MEPMNCTVHMSGEITIKDGRVEQSNFGDYRVLRIDEVPRLDVALVKSAEAPGGIGEPGTPCVMPALTNGGLRGRRQADSQAASRRSVAGDGVEPRMTLRSREKPRLPNGLNRPQSRVKDAGVDRWDSRASSN